MKCVSRTPESRGRWWAGVVLDPFVGFLSLETVSLSLCAASLGERCLAGHRMLAVPALPLAPFCR